VLLMKDPIKGPVPSNYRPITCLPTLWKLFTSCIAELLHAHLNFNDLFPVEQKGCWRAYHGTKDHLLVDMMILREVEMKHKNLQMVWVDYKKSLRLSSPRMDN